MAIDTRRKRSSVLGVGVAVALTLPLSDGTVGPADRAHVAYSYGGIAAGVPVIVGLKTLSVIAGSRSRSAIPGSRTRAAIPGSEN
jgi:hypothetical protein